MKINKYPDAILRERMPDFDFNNPVIDPKTLEKEMVNTMLDHKGLGLSANQVGVRARVFVMGHHSSPTSARAFFNPMIVSVSEQVDNLIEGCLSFPGIYVNIKRPTKIKALWQDSEGNWEEGEFDGYACKCFLHELDHLEGIVFQDRVSALKWELAVKKSNKRKYTNG